MKLLVLLFHLKSYEPVPGIGWIKLDSYFDIKKAACVHHIYGGVDK